MPFVFLGDEDNKHSCSTGHQLRAFAGIKMEVSNEASLFQCNEIKDNDFIIVKGIRKRWRDMKLDYPEWDFDLITTADELAQLKSKFLYVWSKVGEEHYCKKFSMKYIQMNSPRALPESFHYMLLLDSSGSMKGDRWTNLLAGVKELVDARISNGTDDRVTVICFDNTAKYHCLDQKVKDLETTKIRFTGGGTSFGPPFDLVLKTMDTVQGGDPLLAKLKYVIVLMSDGEAEYPEKQLDHLALKKEADIKEFWTFALGVQEMPLLEKINGKMGGVYRLLGDSKDLIEAFAEIAQ